MFLRHQPDFSSLNRQNLYDWRDRALKYAQRFFVHTIEGIKAVQRVLIVVFDAMRVLSNYFMRGLSVFYSVLTKILYVVIRCTIVLKKTIYKCFELFYLLATCYLTSMDSNVPATQNEFPEEYSEDGVIVTRTVNGLIESYRYLDLALDQLNLPQTTLYINMYNNLAHHAGNNVLVRRINMNDSRCIRLMFTKLPRLSDATQLTPQQRVQVVQDVAREVASLHQSGFLLGTINPEQILVANANSKPRGMLWAFKDPCTRDQADNYTAADTSFYRGINSRKSAAGDVQALGMLLVYAIDPTLPPTIANIRGTREVNRLLQEAGADKELVDRCRRCLDPAASTPTASEIGRARVSVILRDNRAIEEGEEILALIIEDIIHRTSWRTSSISVTAKSFSELIASLSRIRANKFENTRGIKVNRRNHIDFADADLPIDSVQGHGAGLARLLGVCLVQHQTIAYKLLDTAPIAFALETLCSPAREFDNVSFEELERLHELHCKDTHEAMASISGYSEAELRAMDLVWNDRPVTVHNCTDYLHSEYKAGLKPYFDFGASVRAEFRRHWPSLLPALLNRQESLRRQLGHESVVNPGTVLAMFDCDQSIKRLVEGAVQGMSQHQLRLLSNLIWDAPAPLAGTRIKVVRGRDNILPTMQTCSSTLTVPMTASADALRHLIDQTLMHENPNAAQLLEAQTAQMAQLRDAQSCQQLQNDLSNCEQHTWGGVTFPAIRLCPKCSATIIHAGDCHHMTCELCKHQFCMHCLGAWGTDCDLERFQECTLSPTQHVSPINDVEDHVDQVERGRRSQQDSDRELQELLANYEMHHNGGVEFPSIRQCPHCGVVYFHEGGAPHEVECEVCSRMFCLRCLRAPRKPCQTDSLVHCNMARRQRITPEKTARFEQVIQEIMHGH